MVTKSPSCRTRLPATPCGHARVRSGDDDRVKGQALCAVLIQAVDQLGLELLLGHAGVDASADLGEGAIRDLLRLAHAGKLPVLLAGAEGVDLLLQRNELDGKRGLKAVELCDGEIFVLKAERLHAELVQRGLQRLHHRIVQADLHDLKALEVLLRGLDVAAVGEIASALRGDNGNALGDVKFRRIHAAVARGQQKALHAVVQQRTVFFQIGHVSTLLFRAMARNGSSSRCRSFSQTV